MSTQKDILEARLDAIKAGIVLGKPSFSQKQMVNWFINIYMPMPDAEKAEIKQAWDTYYDECKASPEHLLFTEARNALKSGDVDRLSLLQSDARQMLKNGHLSVSKPQGYDPEIWNNSQWAIDYRVILSQLAKLNSENW